MKLAEKYLKMNEAGDVSVVHYNDVSRSLYALSMITNTLGDKQFASELEKKSDVLGKLSKKHRVSSSEFDSTMKAVDLGGTFKKLQKVFKAYDDTGKGMKLGRKKISIEDALRNFITVSQKARKEEKN